MFAPTGIGALRRHSADVLENSANELPVDSRALLCDQRKELRRLDDRVKSFDTLIAAFAQAEPDRRCLSAMPGIGLSTATALVAVVGDSDVSERTRTGGLAWPSTEEYSAGGRSVTRF